MKSKYFGRYSIAYIELNEIDDLLKASQISATSPVAKYPKELSKVMQIIHRAISTDIINRAGYLKKQTKTGAVTYIKRFGSALNLNVHFYMLFLGGVITQTQGQPEFNRVKAPSHSDIERVVNTVCHRIAKYLEKAGLLQRDIDKTFLNLPIDDEDSLLQL